MHHIYRFIRTVRLVGFCKRAGTALQSFSGWKTKALV